MEKKVLINNDEHSIHILEKKNDSIKFELNGKEFSVNLVHKQDEVMSLECNGKKHRALAQKFSNDGTIQVFSNDLEGYLKLPGKVKGKKQAGASEGSLQSPMPGKIFKVLKDKGSAIKVGDTIMILEAMKMEHSIKSNKDGVLKEIFFNEGDQVMGGAELCEIE
jgi:3-methylcrotonyl-CoA carboxylase alpha subunit